MPSAEIITIGTEILLGEIVDTNARHIARQLARVGVDIFRTSSIGDNIRRIAEAIRQAVDRAEIVITTGGLGPTVDDPTREAVARAFGVSTEFRPELWQQVVDRFARFQAKPSENNRRQAHVPEGAVAIENPVGTAPAFMMETGKGAVICLPGVPREMEHLLANSVLPYLRRRFHLDEVLVIRLLHTAGVGESRIDELIGDLESLSNPTVGLAAHAGQVDVRIAAKAGNEAQAYALIRPLEDDLRQRLGEWIYGADEETLAVVALRRLAAKGWKLSVVEAGLGGRLVTAFPNGSDPGGLFCGAQVLPAAPAEPETLKDLTRRLRDYQETEAGIGAALFQGERSQIYLALVTPEANKFLRLPYGGPPKLAAQRAANYALDLLRKI